MVIETIAVFFFFCKLMSLSNFSFSALFIVCWKPLFLSTCSCFDGFLCSLFLFDPDAPANLLVKIRLLGGRGYFDELTASEDLSDERRVKWVLEISYLAIELFPWISFLFSITWEILMSVEEIVGFFVINAYL